MPPLNANMKFRKLEGVKLIPKWIQEASNVVHYRISSGKSIRNCHSWEESVTVSCLALPFLDLTK